MNKKKRNYGTKILTMDQFLNYYFNSSYGETDNYDDELSRFYADLKMSHREMDQYLEELRFELLDLSNKKTLEKLKEDIETYNYQLAYMLEHTNNPEDKKRINSYLGLKISDLEEDSFKLKHMDDLLYLCENFNRLSNDDVKQAEVLTGSVVLVADANNNKAYYANPEREYAMNQERSLYDVQNATTEENKEYNLRNVEKVLRKSERNDKYKGR